MATRTYTRQALTTADPAQLAANIDAALSRSGHRVDIAGLTVSVTHPSLVAGDDATINSTIAAYSYNPDFGVAPERISLRNAVATLRQWSTEADASAAQLATAISGWSGTTYTAQKDAVIKATLQGLQTLTTRQGRLYDRLADVLQVQGLNE